MDALEILPPFGRLNDKGKGIVVWMTTTNYQLSTKKLSTKKMENEKKSVWSKILKVVITVLTAIATTFGLQACM